MDSESILNQRALLVQLTPRSPNYVTLSATLATPDLGLIIYLKLGFGLDIIGLGFDGTESWTWPWLVCLRSLDVQPC